MPTDLLLPAFALTLVLNAAFVAIAIRALRDERNRRSRPIAYRTPPSPGQGSRTGQPAPTPAPAARPIDPRVSLPAEPPGPSEPDVRDAAAGVTPPFTPPSAPDPVAIDPPAPTPAIPDPAPATARAAGSSRRRKFSLPPLDEDHEKVSRSIQTFLAGADAATAPAPGEGDATAAQPPVAVPALVTVAAIQIVGSGPRDVLERTVRSSARATDEVSVDRRGRVRIVLPGTGELAAHAYLRRIRATIEPIVEAADPSSRIVTATATDLDGAAASARRRVDRRLAAAVRALTPLAGQPHALDDEELEPLVAGD